jgi:hypothetical protein
MTVKSFLASEVLASPRRVALGDFGEDCERRERLAWKTALRHGVALNNASFESNHSRGWTGEIAASRVMANFTGTLAFF